MSRLREYVPSITAAATPGLLADWREARRHGLDIPAYRRARDAGLLLLPSLDLLTDGIVVDVGANVGEWTTTVLRAAPSATVIAVEPGATPRQALHDRFADDERVTIESRAAAAQPGTSTFHVTKASEHGSLLAPRDELVDMYGGDVAVKETTTVPTTTLDDVTAGRRVGVLKIDVQGAELAVLAGGRDTLNTTRAVLLEVLFVSHYDGDATFPVLHEAMADLGFALANLSHPYVGENGRALWADACYVR